MTSDRTEFEKLEGALVRAGREVEYPATPAIAARVREVLAQRDIAAPRNWLHFALPIAAAVVLALLLLFLLPTTREAVGQFLGLRGLQIFYLTPTPEPTITPTALVSSTITPTPRAVPSETPRPTPTTDGFAQCCETTLADAMERATFPLMLPPDWSPSKVFYQRVLQDGEQVILVFGDPDNPDYVLYEAQQWVYGKLLGNASEEQTMLSETTVNGERALWFSGAPHILIFMDNSGRSDFKVERVVDKNTLVWETGDPYAGTIFRIETAQSLDEARKFAESLIEVKR